MPSFLPYESAFHVALIWLNLLENRSFIKGLLGEIQFTITG